MKINIPAAAVKITRDLHRHLFSFVAHSHAIAQHLLAIKEIIRMEIVNLIPSVRKLVFCSDPKIYDINHEVLWINSHHRLIDLILFQPGKKISTEWVLNPLKGGAHVC